MSVFHGMEFKKITKFFKKIFGLTSHFNDNDIVVFVVGPSGSGKSMFVRAVTEAPNLIEVNESLRPSTGEVHAVRCELSEDARTALGAGERKNIVFVDTPSFHTGIGSRDSGAEHKVATWLKNSKLKSTLIGTIYMHRVEVDPDADMSSSIQKHLDAFSRAFPQGFIPDAFPKRLHCVFSKFDIPADDKIDEHKARFQRQLSGLRPKSIHGCKLEWIRSTHCDFFKADDHITAWRAVEALFSSQVSVIQSTGSAPQGDN